MRKGRIRLPRSFLFLSLILPLCIPQASVTEGGGRWVAKGGRHAPTRKTGIQRLRRLEFGIWLLPVHIYLHLIFSSRHKDFQSSPILLPCPSTNLSRESSVFLFTPRTPIQVARKAAQGLTLAFRYLYLFFESSRLFRIHQNGFVESKKRFHHNR